MNINVPKNKLDYIKAKYGDDSIIQQVVDEWIAGQIDEDYMKKNRSQTVDAKLEFIKEKK